jgi:hypothetical protein
VRKEVIAMAKKTTTKPRKPKTVGKPRKPKAKK